MHLLPSNLVSILKRVDSNCHPLSVVIIDGAQNTATHLETKALAMVSADMSGVGIASGHLVKQSTHVSRYVLPPDGGKGSTKSMCT